MPDSFGVVQLAYDIPIGGSFSFKVDGIVTTGGYCVGLAGFVFDFGDDDNNILDMKVALTGTTVSPSGDGGSIITGSVTGVFEDDDHHVGNVYTQVVLIAVMQGPMSMPTLSNPPSFSSGSSSQNIQLNDTSNVLAGFLTGFSMGYADGSDQGVNTIGAQVSTNATTGTLVNLNGTCILEESSKTEATNLSIWGGLLADSNSSPVFELKNYSSSNGSNKVVFDREVTQAQALLVNFHVQYPGTHTHKVKKMGASYNYFWAPNTSMGLQSDNKTFIFNNPQPFMWDDSNNLQDNSASYANYVVIGAVKTQS